VFSDNQDDRLNGTILSAKLLTMLEEEVRPELALIVIPNSPQMTLVLIPTEVADLVWINHLTHDQGTNDAVCIPSYH